MHSFKYSFALSFYSEKFSFKIFKGKVELNVWSYHQELIELLIATFPQFLLSNKGES